MAATRSRESARRAERAVEQQAREARARAETGSGWYAWLARVGLVAKGISFAIVGILAIEVALGTGGKSTSRQGALQALAQETSGKVLLAVLALGFACYAAWRFVEAFAEREPEGGGKGRAKEWAKRAGYVGRAIIYAGLTFTAVKLLVGSGGQQSQNEEARRTTATIFDWPAGRWLVGLLGLCIFGAGLWNAYRGLSRTFEDRWRTGQMTGTERRWGGRIGLAGHLARAVVFALIGIFVTKAAVDYDPKDAIGIDGALQRLAAAPNGPYLLGVTATGLVLYALFCLVDARYRDVSTSRNGYPARP
jgi:hypothetical protein